MTIGIIQAVIDLIRQKITFRKFKRKCNIEYLKFRFGRRLDYYNCNYKEIVSLGYNCEISQRLSDIFLNSAFEHYLFTWAYEYERRSIICSLKNLNNFTKSKYSVFPWGMIKHERYNIGFHSRFSKKELLYDDNSYTTNVPIAIEELKNRLKHLSEKTLELLKHKDNVLFIIKLKFNNIDDDIEYIQNLNTIINSYFENRNAHYILLVILSKKDYPLKQLKELMNADIKNVKFEVIKSFAHDANTDIDGDIFGWYKVLISYLKPINQK